MPGHHALDGLLRRVVPLGCVGGGHQRGGDATELGHRLCRVGEVVEREGRRGQVERSRPRTAAGSGRRPSTAPVGFGSMPCARSTATTWRAPRLRRDVTRDPGARTCVEDPGARHLDRGVVGHGLGHPGIHPLRPGPPAVGRGGVRRAELVRTSCRLQERGGLHDLLLPPGELVVVPTERLLPAELDHRADQAETELAVPPGVGRDAAALERRAVGLDRCLLRRGEPAAVDREVPREVAQPARPCRAAPSRAAPYDRGRRCRGCRASSCRARRSRASCASASTSGAGSCDEGYDDAGQRRSDLRQQRPALARPAAAPGGPSRARPRRQPSAATARGSGRVGDTTSIRRPPRRPRAAQPCGRGTARAARAGSGRPSAGTSQCADVAHQERRHAWAVGVVGDRRRSAG